MFFIKCTFTIRYLFSYQIDWPIKHFFNFMTQLHSASSYTGCDRSTSNLQSLSKPIL